MFAVVRWCGSRALRACASTIPRTHPPTHMHAPPSASIHAVTSIVRWNSTAPAPSEHVSGDNAHMHTQTAREAIRFAKDDPRREHFNALNQSLKHGDVIEGIRAFEQLKKLGMYCIMSFNLPLWLFFIPKTSLRSVEHHCIAVGAATIEMHGRMVYLLCQHDRMSEAEAVFKGVEEQVAHSAHKMLFESVYSTLIQALASRHQWDRASKVPCCILKHRK